MHPVADMVGHEAEKHSLCMNEVQSTKLGNLFFVFRMQLCKKRCHTAGVTLPMQNASCKSVCECSCLTAFLFATEGEVSEYCSAFSPCLYTSATVCQGRLAGKMM